MIIRTYSDVLMLPTFEERFEYLKLVGSVGLETFGYERYLNQSFYRSKEWKRVRDYVIVRDGACDLAHPDYTLYTDIVVHHLNPITMEMIRDGSEFLLDPEYLITTCSRTHNAIHYGNESLAPRLPTERTPNDTCPWKQ